MENGQPLFNKTKNYLYIGGGATIGQTQPVTTDRIEVYNSSDDMFATVLGDSANSSLILSANQTRVTKSGSTKATVITDTDITTDTFTGLASTATLSTNSNNIKNKSGNYVTLTAALLDMIYPIGSIYMSVNNVSPASFLGGTWVTWASGKVPVGVDTADTDFNSAEKQGGNKASALPSHTHTYTKSASTTDSHSLTISELPSHDHNGITVKADRSGWGGCLGITTTQGNYNRYLPTVNSTSNKVTLEFWAGSSYSNGSVVIGNQGSNSGHTHTITQTTANTSNTGTATTNTNLQPYITCYMWKRTA